MTTTHNHSHGHDHGSGHSHSHIQPGTQHGRAFTIAVLLNTVFVIIEFFYGWVANSTALMADAGHNLSDVLGLILAWGAAILAQRAPNSTYTYGLRSSSILAAMANAIFLLVACGGIAWEAVQRFSEPPAVAGKTVIVVAAIGILINGLSAWLFVKGSKGDLNIRGAFLHLVADAAVSVGVVIAGIVMLYTNWYWLDPLVSLVISLLIIFTTWGLLRQSMAMALGAVPNHIQLSDVDAFLRKADGVTDVHDLHIWGMSTTETAMTVHLVMPEGADDHFLEHLTHELEEEFSIHHVTIQVERESTNHQCALIKPKTL